MGRRIDRLVPVRIRAAAGMPAAVLTVHQLRYQLAFGSRADEKLASQGHQYLGVIGPAVAMLLALAVGLFLARIANAWRDGGGAEPASSLRSLPRIWFLAAILLLAIYCGQEFVEGSLATGHPGGLSGIFGHGGLWAIPLSILLGGLLAVVLRVADAAIRWAACHHRNRRRALPAVDFHRPSDFIAIPPGPLATAAAGRAPPAPLPLPTA